MASASASVGHHVTRDDLARHRVAIIGDHDLLHEHLELRIRPGRPGRVADVRDRRVEAVGLPAGLVALPVVERASEHRQPDRVGVRGRVRERGAAVDPDEDRQARLHTGAELHAVDAVVRARVRHRATVEQAAQELDRLGQPLLADRRRVERPRRSRAYSVNE